jgi:hypothetical protein
MSVPFSVNTNGGISSSMGLMFIAAKSRDQHSFGIDMYVINIHIIIYHIYCYIRYNNGTLLQISNSMSKHSLKISTARPTDFIIWFFKDVCLATIVYIINALKRTICWASRIMAQNIEQNKFNLKLLPFIRIWYSFVCLSYILFY